MTLALDSDDRTRLYALVPCAGTGERAGAVGPKQYALLAGRSVVAHTLAALAQVKRLHATLVVLSPRDDAFEAQSAPFSGWVSRCGGASRAQTVANGLDALIDACADDPVGGLLALPLADTLKSERAGRVEATIDRRAKWQAQTPQMFRIGVLREALAMAGPAVTDEASAMEALGHAPKLVPGALENLKLTYPADFELAERLIRTRP